VWKHHGLPDDIVSDRDSKFISHFWQSLMDLLSVKLNLSTAFHPQTDGQTERVNQTLEAYMRNYCSYQQDDWSDLLPLAEYAYNSAVSEATKFSPFCANYGFEPRTNWPNPKPSSEWDNPASSVTVSQWEAIWSTMHENLGKTRLRMARWYDKHHLKAPEFKPGDEVMLDRRNVQTKRPMNKLDHKKDGSLQGYQGCREACLSVRAATANEDTSCIPCQSFGTLQVTSGPPAEGGTSRGRGNRRRGELGSQRSRRFEMEPPEEEGRIPGVMGRI